MLETLLNQILNLSKEELTSDNIRKLKRDFSKQNKLTDLPTNIQLLKIYKKFISDWKIEKNIKLENLLKKRAIRSMSWIVPIQVLTKPYTCPGQCIFCPTDATMPKSYINTEPGAMRALLNEFDPIKQTYNRLLSLNITWHATDKIEMIVLGGTFDVYPMDYKIEFIKSLYDACNTFDEFYENIEVDAENPKAAKFTINEWLNIKYSETLQQAQDINESANHRIIWLTIETRPEFVTDKNCQFWRELWVTRLEIWVQSCFDDVLEANKRWNTIQQVRNALHKLRQYWFKFSTHFMPWLYKSTVEKDIETFKIAYEDIYLKPDEIKFYPTSVIPNTELYNIYIKWDYKPLDNDQIKFIIEEVKLKYIPPYTRIKRLIRDIPATEIVAWSDITNLRQIVMNELTKKFSIYENIRVQQYQRLYKNPKYFDKIKELLNYIKTDEINEDETFIIWENIDSNSPRNFVCLCTRCREIRNKNNNWELRINNWEWNSLLVIRKYQSSVWTELFISFEDNFWYLYGFTRLLLPKFEEAIEYPWLWKKTALIRELHVYWQLSKIWQSEEWETQHKWIWTQLMETAEYISKNANYQKLSVISWVWVKWYYKKLWYQNDWTYVSKDL